MSSVNKTTPHLDAYLRRHALQLAAQLPDNPVQALIVLGYMQQIAAAYLGVGGDIAPDNQSIAAD